MIEICPVCGVRIEDDRVLFSYGASGSRERLKARVCQYAKNKSDCINQQCKEFKEEDTYGLPTDITVDKWMKTAIEILQSHKVEE